MENYFSESEDSETTVETEVDIEPLIKPKLKRQETVSTAIDVCETETVPKASISQKRLEALQKARLVRSKNCLEKKTKKDTMKKILKGSEDMLLIQPSEIEVLKKQIDDMKAMIISRATRNGS
jgi:hypothetical protein